MVYIPRALYCVTWPIAFVGIGFVKRFFAQLTDSTVVCFQYDIVGQFFLQGFTNNEFRRQTKSVRPHFQNQLGL